MELKKTQKADLENKKQMYFMIGLVLALGVVLVSFEWTTKQNKAGSLGNIVTVAVEEEITLLIREMEVKPPTPPSPKVIEFLNIFEDDVKIDGEIEIDDAGADEKTLIDVTPIVTANDEEEEDADKVFIIVEDDPEFPGGELALRAFIANAIKYPVIAQENGIQGKVYVTFVVGKDGSVKNAVIARGVDASLDKEALRVVNTLPKWNPGKQRGKPVNVSYTVPINFVLQ
ncbi:MAG TPA: energy transducer TonB [Prolixibacteraceae bacterium]|nr:energy transducer TonB [Prolixibacteraceae bacterium]